MARGSNFSVAVAVFLLSLVVAHQATLVALAAADESAVEAEEREVVGRGDGACGT